MTAFVPSWRPFDAGHSIRLLSGTEGSGRIVALLATPGFAVRSSAASLALEVASRWAENGARVFLADGCLGSPRLHLGLGHGGTGLCDLLSFGGGLDTVGLPGPVPGLKVIPVGGHALQNLDTAHMRWRELCEASLSQGLTLALFASMDSDLGRWAVESATDIVVLGDESDSVGELLSSDEYRVRAFVGPARETAPPPAPVAPATEDREEDEVLRTPRARVRSAQAAPVGSGSPERPPAGEGAARPEAGDTGPRQRWRSPERSLDPWAEAAARLRESGAVPGAAPIPPVKPRKALEEPPPPPPRDERIRWSVGSMFRGRFGALVGVAGAAAILVLAFWPKGDSSGPARPIPGLTDVPTRTSAGSGSAQASPRADDPAREPRAAALPTEVPAAEAAEPQAEEPTTAPADPAASQPATPSPVPAARGGEDAPEPGAVTSEPPHQRYSVGLAALSELDAALAWARELAARVPGQPFIVAPIQVNDRVLYRVLGGVAESSDAVAASVQRIRAGTGEDGSGWIVREAPLAFALGDLPDSSQARARIAGLTMRGIPAYLLAVDAPDGSVTYRVYAGAYAGPQEAAYLAGLLREAGLQTTLVERIGRLPR